jgi:hypothetical protein
LDDRPLLFEHTFEEVRLRGAPAAYNTERGGVWQSQVLGDLWRLQETSGCAQNLVELLEAVVPSGGFDNSIGWCQAIVARETVKPANRLRHSLRVELSPGLSL